MKASCWGDTELGAKEEVGVGEVGWVGEVAVVDEVVVLEDDDDDPLSVDAGDVEGVEDGAGAEADEPRSGGGQAEGSPSGPPSVAPLPQINPLGSVALTGLFHAYE